MDQGLPDAFAAQPLDMRAGLAEFGGAQPDFPNRELFADEMIKRYSARDDVAPGLSGGEFDPVIAVYRFDRLALDQSDVAA